MSPKKLEWDLTSKPAHLINRAARRFARLGETPLRALGSGALKLPER